MKIIKKLAAVLLLAGVLSMEVLAVEKNQTVNEVNVGDRKMMAITFDDGPDEKVFPRLVKVLKENGAKATFFVLGKQIELYPGLVKQAFEAGNEIGIHTFSHPHLPRLDEAGVREEIDKAQALVKKETGKEAAVFRAPYGEHSETVWKVLNEKNLPSILASCSVRDWEEGITPEKIRERAFKIKSGGILLCHSWSVNTLAILPEILKEYKRRGYEFATVSELLAAEAKPDRK